MTRQERAKEHYERHIYEWSVLFTDRPDHLIFNATTKEAEFLARLFEEFKVPVDEFTTYHPEFLGWTVQEIQENLTD